jgi:hypothetical protein
MINLFHPCFGLGCVQGEIISQLFGQKWKSRPIIRDDQRISEGISVLDPEFIITILAEKLSASRVLDGGWGIPVIEGRLSKAKLTMTHDAKIFLAQ